MPLVRAQRTTLARVLQWSRSAGWTHDVYPNTWRSLDGISHVRYDTAEQNLVVDRTPSRRDPLHYRVAIVPVDNPDTAVDVLAALGYVPAELSPMGRGLLVGLGADETSDGRIRMTYRSLMADDKHGYMSTYCQHGLHDDCNKTCKCCGAECVCDRCLHTPQVSEPLPVLPSVDFQTHLDRDHAALGGHGDEPDAFDGPASFIEAGQAFADWVDGRVTAEQAAEALSKLARHGLIISVAYHDESGGEVAGQGDLLESLGELPAAGDLPDGFRGER